MCWDHYPGLEWPLGGAAAIWFEKYFLWPFGLFFGPFVSWWPFWMWKKVPTHCTGYDQTRSNLDPRWSTISEPPGLLMATKWPFMAFLDHSWALWRPPLAIPHPGKGSSTSPWMFPDLIEPWSMLIHQFGAAGPAYGHKRTIYGLLEPFRGPLVPPDGHSGPGKGPNTSPWMCPD